MDAAAHFQEHRNGKHGTSTRKETSVKPRSRKNMPEAMPTRTSRRCECSGEPALDKVTEALRHVGVAERPPQPLQLPVRAPGNPWAELGTLRAPARPALPATVTAGGAQQHHPHKRATGSGSAPEATAQRHRGPLSKGFDGLS
eukprot:6662007-Pyramimonas_sp.AAC.1